MKKLPFFIFFLLFWLLPGLGFKQAGASQVDTPTIVEIGPQTGDNFFDKFYLKGLTPTNTDVLVYINGVYQAEAKVGSEGTGSDSFYYESADVFLGESCWVKIIAKDRTSLVLSAPLEIEYVFPSLSAPTLVAPGPDDIVINPKPLIIGLSATQSFVHIYIDGVYNGRTDLLSHSSGTANFSYKPFLNLKPGIHEIKAIAEDKKGRKSGFSQVLKLKIEKPMPAPTLFSPLLNSTNPSQPYIVGLAKNDSFIKIYIDHKLVGSFSVINHDSGTANFSYQLAKGLLRGQHLVYATATDRRGKESQWSNFVYFSTRQPAIAGSAREEAVLDKENNSEVAAKNEKDSVAAPLRDEELEKNKQKKINSTGSINEETEKQNNLSWSLIVFLIFFLGIMGWIIWANRELAKEREQQEEEKNSQLKDDLFS